MYKQMGSIFSFCIAILMICSLFATASEEAKKSPIKVGGAMRVNYAYGSYGDEDHPHPRGEKIGDVDLEIFRLNADLDYKKLAHVKSKCYFFEVLLACDVWIFRYNLS